jgi:antitoxin component YwqK of YwqJK toxin-antitoxin module
MVLTHTKIDKFDAGNMSHPMLKTLAVCCLLFLETLSLYPQNYNQEDGMGRKQGKWLKTYANGNTRYEGQFRDDRPYGTFKYYSLTGKLEAETSYSDDGIVAYTKTYYPEGGIRAEGKYINQKRDSIWRFYSKPDRKLVAEESYKLGLLEGKSIVYYAESGRPAEITFYKENMKSGRQEKFFPEGKLMSVANYENDEMSGSFESYHPNGQLQVRGTYSNGRQTGRWVYYDEEGKEISEEQFKEQED